MQSQVLRNRLLLAGVIVLICGIIVSDVLLCKWAFHDEPNRWRSAICNITRCNVSQAICYAGHRVDYICHILDVVLAINIDGENYWIEVWHSVYDYPNTCLSNTTTCYYNTRKIGSTLDIEKGSSWAEITLGVSGVLISIIVIVVLSVWIGCLSLKSEYIELKNDTEVVLNVQTSIARS